MPNGKEESGALVSAVKELREWLVTEFNRFKIDAVEGSESEDEFLRTRGRISDNMANTLDCVIQKMDELGLGGGE